MRRHLSFYLETMFQCPLCGSNYWGTSFMREWRGKLRAVRDVEDAVGNCNGWQLNDGRTTKCAFVWNRSEDEWVFVPRKLS